MDFMIKAGDPASRWLSMKLPPHILARINPSPDEQGSRSKAEQSEWGDLMKQYALRVVLYSVILLAILLALPTLLDNLTLKLIPSASETLRHAIGITITLVVMSPFLFGLAVVNGSITPHASRLLKRPANRWPIFSLLVFRILIALGFVIAAITKFFKLGGWSVLVIILAGLVLFLIAKRLLRSFSGLEKQFLENLNAREEEERKQKPVSSSVRDKMSRYDIHTEVVEVSPQFAYVGKSLREMPFRKHSGINIIKIQRGAKSILVPSGDEPVYPHDRLVAVGSSAQLEAFIASMKDNTEILDAEENTSDFTVKSSVLGPESFLTGKTLRETDMRKSGCMIISVLHDNKIVTNPGADFVFTEGDTVWIAGDAKSCEWFL